MEADSETGLCGEAGFTNHFAYDVRLRSQSARSPRILRFGVAAQLAMTANRKSAHRGRAQIRCAPSDVSLAQ